MSNRVTRAPGFHDLQGAADFIGPGAIETPAYQPEIFDLVRRKYPIQERITTTPATGHPSRYMEQTATPSGTFVNPRQITASRVTPTRVERFFPLKAISAQLTYGQFDLDVAQQQGGQLAMLQAKDLADTIGGVLRTHGNAIWNGTDTSLTLPTTVQYVGLKTQITRTATIAQDASIEDGLKAEIASLVAQTGYEVEITAIYMNPIACDLLAQELKGGNRQAPGVELTAGVTVTALMTQAGVIPIIPEPALTSTTANGVVSYPIAILSEKAVEYHYLISPAPRVFELGLLANLAQQRVVVMFGAPVAKGPSYAHSIVTLQRAA